jgi:hypothetical protein
MNQEKQNCNVTPEQIRIVMQAIISIKPRNCLLHGVVMALDYRDKSSMGEGHTDSTALFLAKITRRCARLSQMQSRIRMK